jgi:hypothetical protein
VDHIKVLARIKGKIPAVDRERVELAVAEAVLMLFVLALAAYVYSIFRFDGPVYRDLAIYLYGGQAVADGQPPYVGIFDHKGPLPHLLAGLGVGLGRLVGWGDVMGARAVFFALGCLAVVAVYLLGRGTFSSRSAGLLASLSFLSYYAYARPVASGPEPKTPMVLFQTLSLFLLGQKRWLWAALCGSLAFLVWQPMGILPATCVLLALLRPGGERLSAVLRATAGAAIPPVLAFFYFLYHGAVGPLVQGLVLFNLRYVDRHGNWLARVYDPSQPGAVWRWEEVVKGYDLALVTIFIGLAVVVGLIFARPFHFRYLPLLITLPVFTAWTAYDFQAREDFYVFLPYAAVGFGGLIALGLRSLGAPRPAAAFPAFVLLLVALVNTPELGPGEGTRFDLADQRRSVAELEARFGEDPRVVSINAPQSLVLLGQKNPNPYLFTTDRMDRQIDAEFPGGFEGWIQSIKDYDPHAIAFYADGQRQMPDDGMDEENMAALFDWLETEYRVEKIGNFVYYVEKEAQYGPRAPHRG